MENIDSEIELFFKERGKLIESLIIEVYKAKAKMFEDTVRYLVEPPIKGEITKGKLKWRGITQCETQDHSQYWIAQRGKRISPILEISFKME